MSNVWLVSSTRLEVAMDRNDPGRHRLSFVLCLTVDLGTLITLTGASLVPNYALVALAALVGRMVGATAQPLPDAALAAAAILALVALVYITTQQTSDRPVVTGGTILIGLVYWAI